MTVRPATPVGTDRAHRPTTRQVLRPHDLRDANEIAVLRHLLASGPRSRSELAAAVGLTQGPITRLVARLIERGLVREAPRAMTTGRGRPAIPVGLVREAEMIVGVHIGLDRLVMGRTGLDGQVVHRRRATHRNSWATVRRLVTDYVAEAEATAGRPALAVGVIIGGLVEPEAGRLLEHPGAGWSQLDITAELGERTGRPVLVDASVRAQAGADLLFGIAAPLRDFVHVFVGRLVEVAVVVDGVVRAGRDGLGCDITSWTLPDPWEPASGPRPVTEVVGDRRLLARAVDAGLIGPDDYVDALVGAAAREPAAAELLRARASAVGALLARLDAVHAPAAFVVNSSVLGVPGARERLLAALRAGRPGVPSLPAVVAGRYGTDLLVSAAAALVLERTVLGRTVTDRAVAERAGEARNAEERTAEERAVEARGAPPT